MVINELSAWHIFVKRYQLTCEQEDLFKRYFQAMQSWEEFGNITAISDEKSFVELHFDDSLVLTKFIDMTTITSIADIGSGGGFPGIPLKIMFPHLSVYLIEVKRKKIAFLERLVSELGLENVTVVPLDWRTFLRKTNFSIDLFCARASLPVTEFVRMFKPSSPYKHARLVYWAAQDWQAPRHVTCYMKHDWRYFIGERVRRLILFQHNNQASSGG